MAEQVIPDSPGHSLSGSYRPNSLTLYHHGSIKKMLVFDYLAHVRASSRIGIELGFLEQGQALFAAHRPVPVACEERYVVVVDTWAEILEMKDW
jgi:hypothetical protein